MTQIKSIVKKMRTANLHTSEAMPATNLLDVRSIEFIRGGSKSLITNNLEASEINIGLRAVFQNDTARGLFAFRNF